MLLKGKGKFLIVDVEEQSDTQGSITVVGSAQAVFAKGKVVANGPYVIVKEGAEVIVRVENAVPLGLGYPDSFKVVDGEADLVAVLEEVAHDESGR